jgi:hypothetical protein
MLSKGEEPVGATRVIPCAEWETFFDEYTRRFLSPGECEETAFIEVMSASLGVQVEAMGVPLLGMAYDRKSNAFELVLANVDHLSYYPTEIAVIEEDDGFISALEVTHLDGTQEIVQLQRRAPAAPMYVP